VGLLSVEGVVAGYSTADEVLKGVDLELGSGEIVSVIGPNGAGKSTLLKVIAGVLAPSRGRVRLDDAAIQGRAPREISALGVAFVPQERNVFPTLSVRENLEMGGYLEPRRARERVESIFARFPLLAERRRHAARTLSGGQRQILAMAMALMVAPRVLLLDEPSAGLAPAAAERLFETIRAINGDGVAIVMVEQNARRSLAMSQYGFVLDMGRNRFEGPGPELLHDDRVVELYLGGRGRLAAAGSITLSQASSASAGEITYSPVLLEANASSEPSGEYTGS
jgi:branched-chain amino acid transport system ATP-binding protein/neutral amino acid transport system ATP-binding protein